MKGSERQSLADDFIATIRYTDSLKGYGISDVYHVITLTSNMPEACFQVSYSFPDAFAARFAIWYTQILNKFGVNQSLHFADGVMGAHFD